MKKRLNTALLILVIMMSAIFSLYWSQVFGIHQTLNISLEDYASLTTTGGDQEHYMYMATGQDAISPYRYRIAPILPVRLLVMADYDVHRAFVIANFGWLLASACLMAMLVMQFYNASLIEAILAGLLVITATGVSRTVLLPMLDISALFASVLVLYAILDGRLRVFIPVIVFAILTKEVFAIAGLTYALFNAHKPVSVRVAMLMLPVILFSGLRLALGGSALEVNYGFDLAAGETPQYLRNWSDKTARDVFTGGGLLWIGLLSAIFDRLTRIALLTYVLPIIAASLVLSSRQARPLVVIVPVLVIGTLQLIRYINKK